MHEPSGLSAFQRMKMELEEDFPPTRVPTPTAGTSSGAANVSVVEMVDLEESANFNFEDMEDDDEGDDEDDGGGDSSRYGHEDYPPNYGAPKSEVEKLRKELNRVKENFVKLDKQLTEKDKQLAERDKLLAETEEDRIHARIILQYQKDENERILKLLYDEQRKTKQLRDKLNTILNVKKASRGENEVRMGEDEEGVTFLEAVPLTKKNLGGSGSNSQNEPPSGSVSEGMRFNPVIDRTQIYATNRNSIGVVGGSGGGAEPTPVQFQRSTQSQVGKEVGPRVVGVKVLPRQPPAPGGVAGYGQGRGAPVSVKSRQVHGRQVPPPPPPPPPRPRQRTQPQPPSALQEISQLIKTERINSAPPAPRRRGRKIYRGIGTVSRPRQPHPQSQPQPSTSQQAASASAQFVENLIQPQPSTSTTATATTTIPDSVPEDPETLTVTVTPAFKPRRPYKKRAKGSRTKIRASTAARDAAYFERNKDKSNFACNLCPQRYLKLSLLKYHKRQSHNVEDLSLDGVGCVECGFVFPDRKRLFDHRLEAHNIPHPLNSKKKSDDLMSNEREDECDG